MTLAVSLSFLFVILKIGHADRFDCHPESDASQDNCEQRGCIWNATNTPNAPYCYYPSSYGYYVNQCMSYLHKISIT